MNIITMTEAKAAGAKYYFTGVPCPRGHVSERIVSTRACLVCCREKRQLHRMSKPEVQAEQSRKYRAANPEKVKAWKSAEQKRNREAANERNRRYSDRNRDKLRAKNSAYQKANRDKENAKAARRRAKVLRATPVWANAKAIELVYSHASEMRNAGVDVHVDHVIPLQGRNVCGLHVHENLQILNAKANRTKSNHLKER